MLPLFEIRQLYTFVVNQSSHTYTTFRFFFQAGDGIRDGHVTGVQTCALPILFVVPRNASGVRVGEPYDMVAGNALGCTFLVMQDVELPPDALLLGADDGLKFGLEVINHARLYIGAMACGLLRAGLEETINYTSFRELFGHAIINFQGVQWPLADTTTQLIAARQLVDKAAGTAPDAIHFRAAVAHAKKFASTVAYDGLSSCQRLMGANGLLATYDVGRHLHSSIMTYYLDGTSEIQNIMIARSLAS